MEPESYLRFVVAFVFVLSLMGGLWLILRKFGLAGPVLQTPAKRRLKIVESLALDTRRRLVIVQRDSIQHLVILGPTGETIIETQIPAPAHDPHAN